jgi:hypothetical protein
MINKAFALLVTGMSLIGPLLAPAWAEDPTPDSEGGRYTFSKVAEGFLRLDARTGEVSLCRAHAVGWACQMVPEDRAVLENEIARLRIENAALKKDLLARGLPLPAGAAPEPPVAQDGHRPPWNDNTSVDRVVKLVGRLWHRLVDVIAGAPRQPPDKG